ncbi:hypothetical protein [Streptomyces sp. A1547]|uniref:hypothetical protein n=1 Tax=Streptomyces sp. A1547 TaxID=2563105 RepID=UPI00109E7E21|nr:hypothetical protein [Streptomyces sp. A1547]THA33727.1 hypothetical protein E6W17_31000 [Streptomyces sp. A1547]
MTIAQPGRIARWRTRRAERAIRLANAGRLTPAARGVLGIMGTGMVGTGGFAVFVTEVEAGPTALITIGGLLLVLATMGRRISSVSITDGALEFEEQVREELSQAEDDEERVQIASEAVTEQPRIQHVQEFARASESAYRNALKHRLISHFGDQVEVEKRIDDRYLADFVVTAGGKRVVIETIFGDPNRMMTGAKMFPRVRSLLRRDVDGIIIVSNMLEPGRNDLEKARDWATAAAAGEKTFSYVRWAGGVDTAGFISSVEAHLQS